MIRLALAALLLAAPALAQDPPPKRIIMDIPNFQKAAKPKAAEKGMICRKDLETGSLVKTRCRCATPEEWQKSFALTDIYGAADEQRKRVYYDAAECDAPARKLALKERQSRR